jgi:hypothetical protein
MDFMQTWTGKRDQQIQSLVHNEYYAAGDYHFTVHVDVLNRKLLLSRVIKPTYLVQNNVHSSRHFVDQ